MSRLPPRRRRKRSLLLPSSFRAQSQAALGENQDAIRALAAALAIDPPDGPALLRIGLALKEKGEHAEAARAFAAAQKALPDDPAPFLHGAVSLLALGENKAALLAASEACHRAPQLPAAHYAFGQAWLALGMADRAAQAFGAAIKLSPGWADAWVNFGVARYRMGAIEEAKAAMRRALEADPDSQAAAGNLGAFMRITGDADGAERLLRARRASPARGRRRRLNIAADLLQEERSAEALALLDEAAPPRSDLPPPGTGTLQQALALLQLGRTKEARAAIGAFEALGPAPPALDPLLLWRKSCSRALEGDRAQACDGRAHGWKRSAHGAGRRAGAPPSWRITIWRNSGPARARTRAPSRIGRRAIELLAHASSRSRASAHRAFVDATIATLRPRARCSTVPARHNTRPDAGLHRRHAALGHDAGRADPRRASATCTAPASASRWPAFRAPRRGDDAPTRYARIAALGTGRSRRGGADYLAALHALAPDAQRIVDKMPGNFLYLGLVALMLPGAKIIHCARDPRDIGLSIFTFRFLGASRLRARSRRSRLVHRPARPADGALARRAAEPDPHGAAHRLGRGFRRARLRACSTISICRTTRPAPASTKGRPCPHRQPRAGPPARQRARPRPLAHLCTASLSR